MSAEPSREYEVQESERAEADRDAIFFRLLPLIGPERANDRYEDLGLRMQELSDFPGPLAYAIDSEASQLFKCEVRRVLYDGPSGGHRLRTAYRILYTIIKPNKEHHRGIIRILRVLHGAQDLNS